MNAAEAAVFGALTAKGYEVLRRGWPDFLVIDPSHRSHGTGRVFALEWKANGDRVSADQRRMHEVLKALGVPVHIGRSLDQLREWNGRALLRNTDAVALRSQVEARAIDVRLLVDRAGRELDELASFVESLTVLFPEEALP